jgi:hypothetical protein
MSYLVVALRNGVRPGGGLDHLYLADQTGVHADPATVPQHLCWVSERSRAHSFPTEATAQIGRKGLHSCLTFCVAVAHESQPPGSLHFVQEDRPWGGETAGDRKYARDYYLHNAIGLHSKMQQYVEGCCGDKKRMCDNYGCGTLRKFMEFLGEAPPEPEVPKVGTPTHLAAAITSVRHARSLLAQNGQNEDVGTVEALLLLLRDLQRRSL